MSALVKLNNENIELSTLWVATSAGNVQENFIHAHKEVVKYEPYDGPSSQITSTDAILSIAAKIELEKALFSKSAAFSTLEG